MTIAAEVTGVACIAGFAFAVWPPATLLVVGAVLLLMAWRSAE